MCLTGWEQEHVNELDQDAGGLSRGLCRVCQPLVDDHEDQVPKDAEHEQDLRDGHQVDVELLPKVPARGAREAAEKLGLWCHGPLQGPTGVSAGWSQSDRSPQEGRDRTAEPHKHRLLLSLASIYSGFFLLCFVFVLRFKKNCFNEINF